MRKRLTFEEAANLRSFAQAPPRLPDHADVNRNPVYKQLIMRLSHIYEEGEVHRRQDDLRAVAARLGDERLGSGFRPPRSPVPQYRMDVGGPPSGAGRVRGGLRRGRDGLPLPGP